MEPVSIITEFIAFWYSHGRVPFLLFPFESNVAQLAAFLAVLIIPIINVLIEWNVGKRFGKRHLTLAVFIFLAFYMLIDAGMTLEQSNVEKLNHSLARDYFTPLKAILFLAFLGSNARIVELSIRKFFYEKKKSRIQVALLLICSFLSIVSVGLLIDFIKIEFYSNRYGHVIVAEEGVVADEGGAIATEQGINAAEQSDTLSPKKTTIKKTKPPSDHEQRKENSGENLHNKIPVKPEGIGQLLVIFGSEYPCAKSLRLYVDGVDSGTVNLPGRLKIDLSSGVHEIAFSPAHDQVDQVIVRPGKTITIINPLIACKPLHKTELTEILTEEELKEMGFKR